MKQQSRVEFVLHCLLAKKIYIDEESFDDFFFSFEDKQELCKAIIKVTKTVKRTNFFTAENNLRNFLLFSDLVL